MNDSQPSDDAQRELIARWHLSEGLAKNVPSDYNALLEALTHRVHHLMTRDMQRLLTAMYVLDIGEERFRAAMAAPDALEAARSLAQTILDRELEKAASRRKYSSE